MKKLKLIYNPSSGDKSFKNDLDECIAVFQNGGFEVHIYRSMDRSDIRKHISVMGADEYDTIVACGGDGTLNLTLNAMKEFGINSKLGIIPAGTANDFANFLKIPKAFPQAAEVITKGDTILSDIGLANDKYFINVCGAGLLTNISQHIDEDFKNTLGKLAYYIKGIEQVQNFVPVPVRITNSTTVFEEEVFLLLVLNTAGAGSFEKLAPNASIEDGLFDFVAIKNMPMTEIAKLFIRILKGDYLNDSNIIFFQDKYVKIESTSVTHEEALHETDIDGEMGPDMPVIIQNIPRAIEVYYNKQ